MKKERPPCEGGLPPTQTCTLSEGVNGLGHYASAVTVSTHAIEAPANQQAYAPRKNSRRESAKPQRRRRKAYKPAYYEFSVIRFSAIDPNLKPGDSRFIIIFHSLRQKDGRIIAGNPKLSRVLGYCEDTIPAILKRVCAAGYFRQIRKGNGRGIAAEYVLGELFDAEPKTMNCRNHLSQVLKRGSTLTPFEPRKRAKPAINQAEKRGVILSEKGGQPYPPQPNNQPRTKKRESTMPGASHPPTLTEWSNYCLELNPEREQQDIIRTYGKALEEGLNGNWKSVCQRYSDAYVPSVENLVEAMQLGVLRVEDRRRFAVSAGRNHSKASSPNSRLQPSPCESPSAAPLDYSNKKTLVNLIKTADREGTSLEMIKASIPHGDKPEGRALWQDAVSEARAGKTLRDAPQSL